MLCGKMSPIWLINDVQQDTDEDSEHRDPLWRGTGWVVAQWVVCIVATGSIVYTARTWVVSVVCVVSAIICGFCTHRGVVYLIRTVSAGVAQTCTDGGKLNTLGLRVTQWFTFPDHQFTVSLALTESHAVLKCVVIACDTDCVCTVRFPSEVGLKDGPSVSIFAIMCFPLTSRWYRR